MKIKKLLSIFLSNCLIILGLLFLVTKILDWYNPLMDFSGQTEILHIMLGVCAVFTGGFHIFADRRNVRSNKSISKKGAL